MLKEVFAAWQDSQEYRALYPPFYPLMEIFEHIWDHARQSPLEHFTYEEQLRARGEKREYFSLSRPEPGAPGTVMKPTLPGGSTVRFPVARVFIAADQHRVRSRCARDVLRLGTYHRCDAQFKFLDGFDPGLLIHCSTRSLNLPRNQAI